MVDLEKQGDIGTILFFKNYLSNLRSGLWPIGRSCNRVKAEYTLDKSIIHHRSKTENQTYFDCGRKPTERIKMTRRFEPETFL